MPKEDRRIIFSNDEVYKALYTLRDQKNLKALPLGQIITTGVDAGDPNKMFFILEDQHAQTHAKIEHFRDFVAAALMLYCKGYGIPLPKNAQKSVMIQEDMVILRVQM
ncbi:MAG: hypothetical protein ACPG05_05590 [Bdellovibrionales bacterium]